MAALRYIMAAVGEGRVPGRAVGKRHQVAAVQSTVAVAVGVGHFGFEPDVILAHVVDRKVQRFREIVVADELLQCLVVFHNKNILSKNRKGPTLEK